MVSPRGGKSAIVFGVEWMGIMKRSEISRAGKGILKKARHAARASKIWYRYINQPDEPYRYIFHHLPKCGGTSAVDALSHWFVYIKDYPPAWADVDNPDAYRRFCSTPQNLEKLHHYHLLCGHYHLAGSFLEERYPQCLKGERYRLITFVRHPLEVQLSLYYYEIRKKRLDSGESLESRLLLRNNYLASVIPCDEANYQEILDRYFFIGLVEKYQESFDRLATLLNEPSARLGVFNTSTRDKRGLSRDFISEFEENNYLDYQIYDYAKKLLENRS